jgi:2-(1,2-epoxy-1,2-dihydrophenyl)acetyl-CoA isomerase
MKQDDLHCHVKSGVGRIVLRRSTEADALDVALARAVADAINQVIDQAPRVILLSAEGRVGCAGSDLRQLADAGDRWDERLAAIVDAMHPALRRLVSEPIPVVSVVSGSIGGAGIGLALSGDFVLASNSMQFCMGCATLGLSPCFGISWLLARRIGVVRTRQWLMMGDMIDAKTCLAHGVVDALYPGYALANAAESMVSRLAVAAPRSLSAISRLCDALESRELAAQMELERQQLLRCACSDDATEGIRAFVEGRRPRFQALTGTGPSRRS